MQEKTRQEIRQTVSRFIDTVPKINREELELVRRGYPFHAAIFSEEAILYSRQERSIVTRMGMTLFPSLARIVASDAHKDVHENMSIRGAVDAGSLAQLDTIMNELRQGGGKRKPNHKSEMDAIFSKMNGQKTEARIIADLLVGDYSGGPLFMEIKSPLPNIDVAAESKKKILIFELMKREERGRGFLAFAYNPFITRGKYAHSFTKAIMDMETEVLMGSEMWDKLGGEGAYDELIRIVEDVGASKRKSQEGNSKN